MDLTAYFEKVSFIRKMVYIWYALNLNFLVTREWKNKYLFVCGCEVSLKFQFVILCVFVV